MLKIENVRIVKTRPLLTPAILLEEIPLKIEAAERVYASRHTVESILDGSDRRLLVVVGPCSVHDPKAALTYAQRLKPLADELSSALFIIMRVYFEKPRTVRGWKGLINDPDLDGSFQINKGLRLARQLLADISEIGLPTGTEFLDTTFGQFYTDYISWGAIGARTAESQIHRELASGLSMPVGIKNRTDGDMQVAVDAILAARGPHLFPSLTTQGAPAILETAGNPYCHLVLRGGSQTGPNYEANAVQAALSLLQAAGLPKVVMVDCSHGNSQKDPGRQGDVVQSIIKQLQQGQHEIRALMLESHLVGGRQNLQDTPLTFGQSVTDACLGFEGTADILRDLAAAVGSSGHSLLNCPISNPVSVDEGPRR
ncbi:MAG: 3-deoxy-7-phosphoheptulonate synthase [Gammaproteobacteria bacterium]|nr:3-deoxy-7-phosphoheptulonate synthase [Gammaproteobacteria bacterium]MDH3468174.1 3-deoxy-7-phosphoheptulonate synthase [Gammaproteobacteria bacterium]